MAVVTIEGSLSPSALLARGERRTVQLTERVQRLIDAGFVKVVDSDAGDAPEPVLDPQPEADLRTDLEKHADDEAQKARDELGVPSRGGSTEDWQKFLTEKGIDFNDDDSRAVLIDRWDNYDPEA